MNLTADQLEAIDNGQAVRLQAEGRDIVLLNAETYERISSVAADRVSIRNTYKTALKAWGADPGAEVYRDLKGR